ncbi:uncharacterized protein LOC135226482 [Macrobrachium nipponense]|uniref:uncharacterized protein LOC135226482 n=1 Tax=Macrobrachium nipponense TaxID=159736 RepID=UPI0030C7E954
MSTSFFFFKYLLIATNVLSLSSLQDSWTTKSPTEVVESNLTTNAATSLDSLLLSPTVVVMVTKSSDVSNRTESLLVPTMTSLTKETHSHVITPAEGEGSVSPATTREALLISATEKEASLGPTTNGGLTISATERVASLSPSTGDESLLISATGRETFHSQATNGEPLFVSDTPTLTETLSHNAESVGKGNRSDNDFPSYDETETVTKKPLAIASSPTISTTMLPSWISQTEENPFQVTSHLPKPHQLEEKILASTAPHTEVTVSNVIANKCCENSEFLDGTDCVAKTNPSSFDPPTCDKQDAESVPYKFIWEKKLPNCSIDFKYKVITYPGEWGSLEANGLQSYLNWDSLTKQTTQYCIGQRHDGNYSAIICTADEEKMCKGRTCIRKCCAEGEVKTSGNCKRENWSLNLTFHTTEGAASKAPLDLKVAPLFDLDCPTDPTAEFGDSFHLLQNGKLFIIQSEKTIDNMKFCTDYDTIKETNFVRYCLEGRSSIQEWKLLLAPIGMIISILCLAVLILLHFSTKKLMSVQGYCFLSYSISLLLEYVGLIVSYKYSKQLHKTHCIFNGLFTQFAIHSAFFWLSVMCFDIWRVVRSTVKLIPLRGILEKDIQIFLVYTACAFGGPLVIALVTLIMQSLPPEASDRMITPGFGKESCWYEDQLAQFLYLYLAIATLNILSLCMLGHVIYLLCLAEPGMECCHQKRKAPRAFNRKHLSIFRQRLSLFVVMTFCWFTEVLSLKIPPMDAWVVTDLLNTLQGVIVFLIFLLSKQKRQLVKERLQEIFKMKLQRTDSNETEESAMSNSQEPPSEMASMPSGTQVSFGGNTNSIPILECPTQLNGTDEGCYGGIVNEGLSLEEEEGKGVNGADETKEIDSHV